MEKYRVLLVDDEEELRFGIRRKIPWEELGFTLAGEAENGREALELAEQIQPDVVLTDIKMPFMDGLELCRRLRKQFPAVKLLIFSGFDDFEYARQAIGANVFEYILKPINAQELSQVLVRLHEEMDTLREEQRNVDALREKYEKSLPMLQSLFFARLLVGQIPMGQVEERAKNCEVVFPKGNYLGVRIYVQFPEDAPRELHLLRLQEFFEKEFQPEGCFHRGTLYEDDLALLLSFPREDDLYFLVEELERIRALGESYLGFPLTVAVGYPVSGVWRVSHSMASANTAMAYRMVLGGGKTLYIGDLEPKPREILVFRTQDEQALINVVKLGTPEQLVALSQKVVPLLKETSPDQLQCYFLEMLTCLIRIAREGELPLAQVFGEGFTGAVQLSDFSSPEDLVRWMLECCLKLQRALFEKRSSATQKTVDKACRYIEENYADSALSVETLCSYLHLSSAYFSTLFKKETAMGFAGYVTKIRMEAAAKLLRDTEDKTYLIAGKVGYEDPNYFSYAFKKYYGVSPSKFRASSMEP